MTRLNALIITPIIALTTLALIGNGFYTLAFIGVLVSSVLCLVSLARRGELNDGELLVFVYSSGVTTAFGLFWLIAVFLIELS